ncbi:Kinetochore protein [Yarrowia sp. B02]|nr:Kinetochore protein [Yarrowia sp. B02]
MGLKLASKKSYHPGKEANRARVARDERQEQESRDSQLENARRDRFSELRQKAGLADDLVRVEESVPVGSLQTFNKVVEPPERANKQAKKMDPEEAKAKMDPLADMTRFLKQTEEWEGSGEVDGGILKKDDNNTVIGVPFETAASSSASRASLNRSKRRVSFAPEATMTTFENLTPLRNFASAQERGHVTQQSFGGFSKPGFGAVVDWKEERDRARETRQKSRETSKPGLSRDPQLSRDTPGETPDSNPRQSLSTIFGNFKPSRDSLAGTESFSESRDYDASMNQSRDLSSKSTVVKTSFKELFQRAMSKSRESGSRDSFLRGVATRDRNSILGSHVTGTLVEEDEGQEVEMELTEVQLREKSGLAEMSVAREESREESRDETGSRDTVYVDSANTSLAASPVKVEEDDGMDFTNVPRASRDSDESSRGSRDSGSSRGSRDSGEMDFTNVTLARDMAGMDFTNVGQTPRSRALSRISEHDSDSMDYTSVSIPSVARIVSEEVLVRSGLSPGGSPRVREVGETSGMDFTNVPRSGGGEFSVREDAQGEMSFTNVPRRGSSSSTDTPRGIKRRRVDDEAMEFTDVVGVAGDAAMDFTRSGPETDFAVPKARVSNADTSAMDFTGPVAVAPESEEMSFTRPVEVPAGEDMSFTRPVTAPTGEDMSFIRPVTAPESEEMSFTRPVTAPTGEGDMSFTRPVTAPTGEDMSFTRPVTAPSAEDMSFTRPVTAPSTGDMSFTHPVEVPHNEGEMSFTRPVEVPQVEEEVDMSFTRPVEVSETEIEEEVDMSFTRPVEVPETEEEVDMSFTRPVEVQNDDMSLTRPVEAQNDDNMSFTRPVEVPETDDMSFTNTNITRSTGTGMDFTRPVPGGVEIGEIETLQSPKLSRDSHNSNSRDSDYEFTTFGQQLDSSTRLVARDMRDEEMEKSLEEPLEAPPEDDHVTRFPTQVSVPLSDVATPESRERPLSTIAETTEREDSAGNSRGTNLSRFQGNKGVTVAANGTFGTQYSTPFSTPAAQLSTPGKRPFSELSREDSRDDETPNVSRDDMDLTAPMSLKHRFELLSTPRQVKVKRGADFRIGSSVSRDTRLARDVTLSRVGDFGSPALPPDSLTMSRFLQMIDMQFMDDFLLPGKRQPRSDASKCSLTQYLVNSYLHPHVQLYSWAVEHLRKDIEVRSLNFAQLDQDVLSDVPPIFVDYTSADSGVKLLLNKQFALDKQYYRVEARRSWYEWRRSISMDLFKRLATNRDLLRSDLRSIDLESETVSTQVADLKHSLNVSNAQLTQLKNLSTDVELKRHICSELQAVQKELLPLVDKLEQVNQTVGELETQVSKELQKQDEIKTQLLEEQKRLLDNRHIDFHEIEQLQEKLKKAEQKKGLKLVKFEPDGNAVFESRDLRMTVSRESNFVVSVSAKSSLGGLKLDAVKLLPLGTKSVSGVTKTWAHVTQFFDALAEIKLAFNCGYHVTSEGQFELFIKLLTHKGQSRTDVQVRFPFAEILTYPHMEGCHVTSKVVYGASSGVMFTSFDSCLEVLLGVK